ncbi:hypothetical protein [Arthrobacter sp. ISL-30]|uniref:hypothetical protein n=1 Tax=Arthrobacter sp. ISL-30 TaxID=2819109 RepID=UPI001BE9A33A|nr:hypothetical protein [Arthrobacter sp. ISL-30]MBT2515320.1 hypothetical protein [Arthrobacter sp. ISL-30]
MAPGQDWTPFRPYAGYLHVVPRLAAEVVVRFFAVADYAQAMTVLACAGVAVVAVLTFHCAQAVTQNVWIRGAWAAIPVFVNVGAIETLGNFANFHWYLLWLAPWLLIKPAKSVAGAIGLFTAASLTSLTEIISIVFVPLFFFRWKDRAYWPARIGLAIGLACQVSATLSYPRSGVGSDPIDPLSVIYGWFINTAGPIAYGNPQHITQQIINFGAAPIVIVSIVMAVVVAAVIILGTRRDRRLAGLFIAASAVVWAACVVVTPTKYFDYAHFSSDDWKELFTFSRYSVVPTMFVLGVVPILASAVKRVSPKAPFAVLIGFALMLMTMYFPAWTVRDSGPVWADNVMIGKTQCATGGIEYFVVPTSPSFYGGNVPIPCRLVQQNQ